MFAEAFYMKYLSIYIDITSMFLEFYDNQYGISEFLYPKKEKEKEENLFTVLVRVLYLLLAKCIELSTTYLFYQGRNLKTILYYSLYSTVTVTIP